ncbi:hypothetical protein [Arthrobacter sp. H20]|uniref:hypothetical protein n=1 Tax=Arthrobacter sp. H20 TaxID=1267981 RepID=UPI000478DB72|nr:hypothetical protein [Arthrobacter sp. H20]
MNITVTVKESHRSAINEVAERLRAGGIDIDRVLGAGGMVTGSAPDDCRSALEAVEGVASVDAGMRAQLPPPEGDVQ